MRELPVSAFPSQGARLARQRIANKLYKIAGLASISTRLSDNLRSRMDDLDQRLIACLRDDARAPTTALAKALGVSRATVQSRIDRLRASGVLLGFTVRLQPEAVAGHVRALASIQVEGPRSEAVVKALRAIPAVTAVHTTNGRWDLVAELETVNLEEFSRALDAIRAIQGIAATETSLLLKSHRF